MLKEAIILVSKSSSWENFVKKCDELGSSSLAKKIKGNAFGSLIITLKIYLRN